MTPRRLLGVLRSLVIYYGQPWKWARMRRFYAQFLARDDLAFDVGSHVGNRVACWRSLGVRVVAVEPQPDFVAILRGLFGRDKRVSVEPIGLAAEAGSLELRISRSTPTVSTLSRQFVEDVAEAERWSGVSWDDTVAIEVRTLDALIAEYGVPTFCKIDVEGFEPEVLRGLSQPIPSMSFEFVPAAPRAALACLEELERLGPYVFRTSLAETMRWVEPDWLPGAELGRRLRAMPPDAPSGDIYAQLVA